MPTTDVPIFLVGATATGKSAVALELARTVRGAILAMDAMQVYRGADIGTSKPSSAERAEVPHGGLDLVDFGASFDVAQYLKHAGQFLWEQREAGRRVIIVGGTGLYFRALTQGLCEAPQGPDELRVELNALSTGELRQRLGKVDPGMLDRVDTSNPRRLVRAIEVMEVTGRSLRDWQDETPEPLVKDFAAYWICREKEELTRRIEVRVKGMFAQGWVEEVRGLIAKHGPEAVKAFPGIGYREIAEERGKVSHGGLKRTEEGEGKGGEAEAMELRRQLRSQMEFGNEGRRQEGTVARRATATEGIKTVKSDILVATRQYAKRQLTWFAREPKLQKVMLTGSQPLSEVVPSLL